jgi:hypothetical protein
MDIACIGDAVDRQRVAAAKIQQQIAVGHAAVTRP